MRTFGDEADNGMWPVLDIGIVHDSAMTARNDVEIFVEEFVDLRRLVYMHSTPESFVRIDP